MQTEQDEGSFGRLHFFTSTVPIASTALAMGVKLKAEM